MASPAIAKNALAVGAATNTADSFFELRLAVGLAIEAPATAAATIRLVPAMCVIVITIAIVDREWSVVGIS